MEERTKGDKITERDAIILVYDVSNPESFASLQSLHEFVSDTCKAVHGKVTPLIVIVGNKMDCDRNVNSEEAEVFASQRNCPYLECSSLVPGTTSAIFEVVVRELRKRIHLQKEAVYGRASSTNIHGLEASCASCVIF